MSPSPLPLFTRPIRWSLLFLVAVGLAAACGETRAVSTTSAGAAPIPDILLDPVTFIEADEACVDFYRSAAASVEEEQLYMRRLADRITDLGHVEAAAVLDDLAGQWEVGVWEGEEDEVWQSGLWAQAGRLLAEQGAIRCADLAEWWGIDGYEGEPDPEELVRRQAQIWRSSRPADYYLLVVAGHSGQVPTQVQVHVVGRDVVESTVVVDGALAADDLPLSVEELYSDLLDSIDQETGRYEVQRYDLANSVPAATQMHDLFIRLFVDPERFPPPVEVHMDTEEGG